MEPLIPKHGDYRNLKSFQVAQLVYELKLTSVARASLEELKLDYEDFLRQRELALWPLDDLRRKDLVKQRPKSADDVAQWVRAVHGGNGPDGRHGPDGQPEEKELSMKSIPSMPSISPSYSEIAANGAHTLIGVACSLLDRQMASQARAFEKEGGFSSSATSTSPAPISISWLSRLTSRQKKFAATW